jgi:hypothetical protein
MTLHPRDYVQPEILQARVHSLWSKVAARLDKRPRRVLAPARRGLPKPESPAPGIGRFACRQDGETVHAFARKSSSPQHVEKGGSTDSGGNAAGAQWGVRGELNQSSHLPCVSERALWLTVRLTKIFSS